MIRKIVTVKQIDRQATTDGHSCRGLPFCEKVILKYNFQIKKKIYFLIFELFLEYLFCLCLVQIFLIFLVNFRVFFRLFQIRLYKTKQKLRICWNFLTISKKCWFITDFLDFLGNFEVFVQKVFLEYYSKSSQQVFFWNFFTESFFCKFKNEG